MLIASALVTMTLSGCASFGSKAIEPSYPTLPVDLQTCFDTTVPAPKPGPMTKRKVIMLIAELKKSEAEKTECGKRLIAFYESLSNTGE